MSTDLLQHLRNVVERRGFAAALDTIEPVRSGTGATEQLNVDRPVGHTAVKEAVVMTTPASS